MMKRILVGLAGTTYTPIAIQRAVTLATAHQAEVTGVTVINTERLASSLHSLPTWGQSNATREQRLNLSRAQIIESVRAFEVACVEAQVRYHDLMIFGLRSIFEYDFQVGNPESLLIKLVDAGVRPVVAVTPELRNVSRVLIAYNGSMESAKAMKRFVQMRLWPDAELKIMTFQTSDIAGREQLMDAETYCRAHGYRVCSDSNPGSPKSLLLAAASLWQADMIVMGNSARSVLVRKVLGDTLVEVIRDSKIPLFLAQ